MLFFTLTYTWLMWGPSVYLADIDDNYKLVTYGYGDEANSLSAVLKISSGNDLLWSQLKADLNSCYRTGMVCKIFPAASYFNKHRSMFSYSTMPFIDILVEGNESGIIAEVESISHNLALTNGYFSAYIWIMFNREDNKKFEPDKSVVFFEHANIADIESYTFFKRALIEKCFQFFRQKAVEHKFKFCFSFNADIENSFKESLSGLNEPWVTHIDMSSKLKINEIVGSFETLFDTVKDIIFVNVDVDQKNDMLDLFQFYVFQYTANFKNEDERESIDNIILALRQSKDLKNYNKYRVVLAKNSKNEIIGGIIFDYLSPCNCGVVEFIVTDEKYRNMGFGEKLFPKAIEWMNHDAKAAGHSRVDNVFAEMDDPQVNNDTLSRIRTHFWNKLGFKKVDIEYVQPSLSIGKNPVKDLILLVQSDNSSFIETSTLSLFLKNYFQYAMRIDHPEANKTLSDVLSKIKDLKHIRLHNL